MRWKGREQSGNVEDRRGGRRATGLVSEMVPRGGRFPHSALPWRPAICVRRITRPPPTLAAPRGPAPSWD